MGHVTTDRLSKAWRKTKTAERHLERENTDRAVGALLKSVEECQRSDYGMDKLQEFVDLNGDELREKCARMEERQEVAGSEVRDALEEVRSLLQEIRPKLEGFDTATEKYTTRIPRTKECTRPRLTSVCLGDLFSYLRGN